MSDFEGSLIPESGGRQNIGSPSRHWFAGHFRHVTGLLAPVTGSDAATKTYVDNNITGLLDALVVVGPAPVDAVAATATITDGGLTNVTNNKKVTIGGQAYTFKTTLTPADYEVLIGGDADTSLQSLADAINDDCIANCQVPSANANVTAGAVGSNATVLTAAVKGVSTITLTTDDASLTIAEAPFGDGVDGTAGTQGQLLMSTDASSDLYYCVVTGTIHDTGVWKKVTIGSLS